MNRKFEFKLVIVTTPDLSIEEVKEAIEMRLKAPWSPEVKAADLGPVVRIKDTEEYCDE